MLYHNMVDLNINVRMRMSIYVRNVAIQIIVTDLDVLIKVCINKRTWSSVPFLVNLRGVQIYLHQLKISTDRRLHQVRVITVLTVFRLLTDFVCLYNYEFWLSLCKIVRSSVILLLPLFTVDHIDIVHNMLSMCVKVNRNLTISTRSFYPYFLLPTYKTNN